MTVDQNASHEETSLSVTILYYFVLVFLRGWIPIQIFPLASTYSFELLNRRLEWQKSVKRRKGKNNGLKNIAKDYKNPMTRASGQGTKGTKGTIRTKLVRNLIFLKYTWGENKWHPHLGNILLKD
jgi:hypothetical protein